MSAIADNLIHFLGRQFKESPQKQFEILKAIIQDGLRCSKIQIKFGDGGVVFNQVVCFTDIPLSECDEHVAIYGKFGIGFKKSFVKRKGGNPARYFIDYMPGETKDETLIENRGLLYLNLCNHFKIIKQIDALVKNDDQFTLYDREGNALISHENLEGWVKEQIAILSFEKETGDIGPARDETKEIDLYYKEREWRLVPLLANVISGSVELGEGGSIAYKFNRSDVNVVVTPNDEIRTDVLKYFLNLKDDPDPRLKAFSENPLPVITYDDLHKW
jgi:hypothetical protein